MLCWCQDSRGQSVLIEHDLKNVYFNVSKYILYIMSDVLFINGFFHFDFVEYPNKSHRLPTPGLGP